jgi:putative transposase
MPRQPRLVIAGYPHHVILRGNNRAAVFYNDKDRHFFLTCLKEAKEKTNSKIYAYCLMTNHVHLLIEPSTENGLAEMMQSLGRRYVQYINQTYARTGTLWEGRFKSSVVSKEEYFLACCRYIELNPLRAKLTQDLSDYVWSSFQPKAEGKFSEIIDEDVCYSALGTTQKQRQENYKRHFLTNTSEKELDFIRVTTQRCGVIGNPKFTAEVAKLAGRDIFLRERGRPKKSL